MTKANIIIIIIGVLAINSSPKTFSIISIVSAKYFSGVKQNPMHILCSDLPGSSVFKAGRILLDRPLISHKEVFFRGLHKNWIAVKLTELPKLDL